MLQVSGTKKWNAETYDEKFNFVSEYGKGIGDLLNPQPSEKILDLGCGTGDLTYEISKSGASIIGMDASPQMIKMAQEKYNHLQFIVANGENFQVEEQFDAVFSNAALHWMKNAGGVIQSVHRALRQDGRFVAELGGKGNIATIEQAITYVFEELYGIDTKDRNPWYFPSIGEYSLLLEKNGLKVIYARHFERPTMLPGREKGLYHFLDQFANSFFYDIPVVERKQMYEKIKMYTKMNVDENGNWIADYHRLQIIARKE